MTLMAVVDPLGEAADLAVLEEAVLEVVVLAGVGNFNLKSDFYLSSFLNHIFYI